MDDSSIIELKKLLEAPNILAETAAAAEHAGPWRSWTFERQVWYLRKHRGLTQAELSKRSGVSQRRVSRIEAGEDLKFSTLLALWRALGCQPLIIPDKLELIREPRPPRPPRKPRARSHMSPKTSPHSRRRRL